jgi:hypothetical protein
MQSERREACGALIFSTVATTPLTGEGMPTRPPCAIGLWAGKGARGIPDILSNIV